MANINTAVPKIWNAGGKIIFTAGATTYDDIDFVEEGSLEWTDAQRTRVRYSNRGAIQTPLEGDDTPARIKFTVKIGEYAATKLWQILTAAGTGGAVGVFTNVIIKIYVSRGGATGHILTWATCWLASPPEWKSGAGGGDGQCDKMSFELESGTSPVPTTF